MNYLNNIILVHNRYLIRGGEDECFDAEKKLLINNGINVIELLEDNRRIQQIGTLQTAIRTIWANETLNNTNRILESENIDVIHVHNFFPLISPSIFYAAKRRGIPIVFTIHNQRLFCANGYFLRDQKICEKCSNRKFNWPAIRFRCYRNSLFGSFIVALMQCIHRCLDTWNRKIDVIIALTEFARSKLIQNGINASSIEIKPNFIEDEFTGFSPEGDYALYIGRLSDEKGVHILLDAWKLLQDIIPLKIIGDGELKNKVSQYCEFHKSVSFIGKQSHDNVINIMRNCKVLIVPSICYEGMPRVIIEAFMLGKPVIASNLGGIQTMITDENGYLFPAGDSQALANALRDFLDSPDYMRQLKSEAARKEYLEKYSSNKNFSRLMEIYQLAIDKNKEHPKWKN